MTMKVLFPLAYLEVIQLITCSQFMQRAAASTPPSAPQLQSRSPHIPYSKRQKVSVTPSSTSAPPSDLQLIQVALTQEAEKREKAVERLAEDAGETKWVLSTVDGEEQTSLGGLRIVETGYSTIDQEAWRPSVVGRRSFGKFNRELEVSIIFISHFLVMFLRFELNDIL